MQKIILLFTLYCFFCLCSSNLSAQKFDSTLNIYNEKYKQEKLHIHFDKSIYNKGETIWMKLYLMVGAGLSTYSKNIYVDWYNKEGELLKHTSAPIEHSSAKMQFEIPDTFAGSSLHLVAYTRWMLNFDSSFLYCKEIPLAQKKSSGSAVPVSSIHFFPEGGNLVNGLLSFVAFKANDQWGRPVKVTGLVKTNEGVFVDSIITVHDGMGIFSVQPKKGEGYIAYWKDVIGIEHSTALPVAKDSGITLELHPMQGKTLFVVKRSKDIPDNIKLLHLTVTMNQELIYHFKLNLSVKTTAISQIKTDSLPTGILTVTIFDTYWVPLAERIVFVNNHQYEFHPAVTFTERSKDKRGKNVLQIDLPDTLLSNLSVSVTDADILYDSSNNIQSQFLLCGDLKGYINNPAYYFTNTSNKVAQQLDLVMLTNGWRRYKWEEIAAGKFPVLKYQQEANHILVEGKVSGDEWSKLKNKPALNLMLSDKYSSPEVLSVTLSPDASFSYDKGIFYDTLDLYYEFKNNRSLTSHSTFLFQNGLIPAPQFNTGFIIQSSKWTNRSDSNIQKQIRLMLEEQEQAKRLDNSTTLKDVVVKTRVRSRVQLLDDKYAKGFFSGGDAYQFDIVNDLIAQTSPDILTYLQGRVPGIKYVHKTTGNAVLAWRGRNTDLYINEMRIDTNNLTRILNIPVTEIAYVKVFRPIFYGSASGGDGGAVAIYLRDGAEQTIENKKEKTSDMAKSFISGYTAYKEFYSPDYSTDQSNTQPDMRTTLYWNPNILMDAVHQSIQLPFFNNDINKKLRVIIEGINEKGKLTRIEKTME